MPTDIIHARVWSRNGVFVTDATPARTINAPDAVHGLAILDGKLYVLRHRDDNQLYVYNIGDYQLQYTINISGLTKISHNDLTECVNERCLFVSAFLTNCIYKVEPNGEQSKVSKFIDVPYQPKGLSITPEGNLLVACNPNKLVEYKVNTGDKVCEVDLHMDINYPSHAVKRSDGHYVVCHTDEKLSRVCRVGKDGYFRHCFGGLTGAEADQLNYGCHLALRDDNYVIVADNDNNRLLLLDKSMEFVKSLVVDFREPHRVWIDPQSRLLYVGECMNYAVSDIDKGCIKVFNVRHH